jgi:DNA segregation ATPase FtsK/SpoIIIE-like protein
MEGDSFLMAGSRGMGKTGLIHGCIQALLYGGKVEVYGFDGKRGVEFSRYIGDPMFRMAHKLGETLTSLKAIAANRRRKLLASGQPNILLYNKLHSDDQMRPIALFVDEAALTSDEEKAGLVEIVERERDTGFYPVLATNRPEAAALLVKTNLVTRICFPVPSWHTSQMVLGMNGAEALPKEQGRGLIVFKARVTEFQSFRVTYPVPSEDTVKMMLERDEVDGNAPLIVPTAPRDEIAEMAERIRGQWNAKLNGSAVARLLGLSQYGGSYKARVDKVIAYLTSTIYSTTQNMPDNGVLGAVELKSRVVE